MQQNEVPKEWKETCTLSSIFRSVYIYLRKSDRQFRFESDTCLGCLFTKCPTVPSARNRCISVSKREKFDRCRWYWCQNLDSFSFCFLWDSPWFVYKTRPCKVKRDESVSGTRFCCLR